MSLDLIKEIRGYTDEMLLDEYAYNFQISNALGLRTLGECYFVPRTLYKFRARLYNYSLEHSEEADLIFVQFEKLTITNHSIKVAKLSTDEARMDSNPYGSHYEIFLHSRSSIRVLVVKPIPVSSPVSLISWLVVT